MYILETPHGRNAVRCHFKLIISMQLMYKKRKNPQHSQGVLALFTNVGNVNLLLLYKSVKTVFDNIDCHQIYVVNLS